VPASPRPRLRPDASLDTVHGYLQKNPHPEKFAAPFFGGRSFSSDMKACNVKGFSP
jgi:hypothetical protein